MKQSIKACVVGIVCLATTSGCSAGGASAEKYASVLSSHQWKIQNVAKAYYEMAYSLDPNTLNGLSTEQALVSPEYKNYVSECKSTLNDLDALGTPEKEIASLVAETKDAFSLCQQVGPGKNPIDFANTYLANSENILKRWIPYGVPQ